MQLIKGLEKYEDKRGVIENILPPGVVINSVLFITGKDGAVRGDHYHKEDEHYCVVLSGVIKYQYIPKGEKLKRTMILKRGDIVHTPKEEKHRFIFLKKGAFLAMATQPRSQENYEKDTIRVSF